MAQELTGCFLVQEIERLHTDALERMSQIKHFSLPDLLAITEEYTDNVRNAALRFTRYAASLCMSALRGLHQETNVVVHPCGAVVTRNAKTATKHDG